MLILQRSANKANPTPRAKQLTASLMLEDLLCRGFMRLPTTYSTTLSSEADLEQYSACEHPPL
eukprot:266628-Amphidinium_carterae.1